MTEPIEAGEYELVVDRWDERVSELDQPFRAVRHYRGDVVTLDQEEAERLVKAGAVVKPGELELAAVEAARQQYLATLAALPDNLRALVLGETEDGEPEQTEDELAAQLAEDDPAGLKQAGDPEYQGEKSPDPAVAVSTVSPEPSGGDRAVGHVVPKPKRTAGQPAWAAFAVARGARREDAEAMSREDLVARYGEL